MKRELLIQTNYWNKNNFPIFLIMIICLKEMLMLQVFHCVMSRNEEKWLKMTVLLKISFHQTNLDLKC